MKTSFFGPLASCLARCTRIKTRFALAILSLSRRQRRCLFFFLDGPLHIRLLLLLLWVSSIDRSARASDDCLFARVQRQQQKNKSLIRPTTTRQQLNKRGKKEEETDVTKFCTTHDLDFFFLAQQSAPDKKDTKKKRGAHSYKRRTKANKIINKSKNPFPHDRKLFVVAFLSVSRGFS
nr:hypothetical protein [Pandoravirus massiliensis]